MKTIDRSRFVLYSRHMTFYFRTGNPSRRDIRFLIAKDAGFSTPSYSMANLDINSFLFENTCVGNCNATLHAFFISVRKNLRALHVNSANNFRSLKTILQPQHLVAKTRDLPTTLGVILDSAKKYLYMLRIYSQSRIRYVEAVFCPLRHFTR